MKTPGNKPTVMIVDDSAEIREVFSMLVNDLGCLPVEAANGQQALQILREGVRPDLILLDLMMPVMDGWQTDRELAKNKEFAQIPTVVVSAFSERINELQRKLEVLQKPLSSTVLKKTIQKYCFELGSRQTQALP